MHHDAQGFATWIQVLSGYKIWAFTRAKGLDIAKNRHEMAEAVRPFIFMENMDEEEKAKMNEQIEAASVFAVLAGPGDIV